MGTTPPPPPTSGGRTRWGSPVPLKRPRIEIIPLIDVMFFLLAAFMMVSLSMEKGQHPPMDLPVSRSGEEAFRPDALSIGVQRDGGLSVGTNRMDWVALEQELARRHRADPQTPVFVAADRMASHGSVQQVLDRVRRAGFERVSFVTSQGVGGGGMDPQGMDADDGQGVPSSRRSED
jgi:biopolymer transport protein ExbD